MIKRTFQELNRYGDPICKVRCFGSFGIEEDCSEVDKKIAINKIVKGCGKMKVDSAATK